MSAAAPTIWGLSPIELHDRFWATRGVQVVRCGCVASPSAIAPFFLLIESSALLIFDPAAAEQSLSGVESDLMYVHLRDARLRNWREHVVTDADDRFVRFERLYDRPRHRLARAALTRHAAVAHLWHSAPDSRAGWRRLRRELPRSHRATLDAEGMLFDGADDTELAAMVGCLVRCWTRPDLAVDRAVPVAPGIWKDREAFVAVGAKLVAPVWIGGARRAEEGTMVIGPAVLWDAEGSATAPPPIDWKTIFRQSGGALPFRAGTKGPASASRPRRWSKRAFDLVFSTAVILCSLPLYPFIMLAILLEDGWPVFFTHRRETVGGREFPCLKFRSMHREAEQLKGGLRQQNQADGPQFYIANDPRLTRIGRRLRQFHLDELPQFFNVLAGDMSVVGPRPSPFSENQFCPAWRDARLSVRPGVTGLWQIKRTRAPGTDFQEWIRYDLEYVENACWSLDLQIIWKTLVSLVRR